MASQRHTEKDEEDASAFLLVPDNTPTTIPSSPTIAATEAGASSRLYLDGVDMDIVSHLQKSLSALSLDRAAEEDQEEQEGDNTKVTLPSVLGMENVVSIGISGATSSGKTTLAIILAEIFTSEDMAGPSYLGSGAGSASTGRGNMVINQDAFFFHKGACELTSFRSSPGDAAFCRVSLQRDEVDEYVICYESQDRYKITGPDTDHLSAVNFWGLLKAVRAVKEEGLLPTIQTINAGAPEGFGCPLVVRVSQEQINEIKLTHSNIISQSKQVVASWIIRQSKRNSNSGFDGLIVKQSDASGKPAISPKILFLDGFLLYHNPTPNTLIEDSDTEDEDTRNRKNFAYGRMGMFTEVEKQKEEDDMAHFLLSDLEKKFQRGVEWEDAEIDYIQEHHYLAIKRAMKQLMPLMDIKLFLTTSMQAANARRLQRPEYIDEPLGTRKPGQMWKTEGYFENVAWKNHILQHNWLIDFKGSALPGVVDAKGGAGILVREPTDASVDDTVQWAVTNILLTLTNLEEAAGKIESLKN